MGLQLGGGVLTNSSSITPSAMGVVMMRTLCLAVCAAGTFLFFLSRVSSAPQESVHSVPSGAVKAEIERVSTEIDKIFADALAEVPSIPGDAAHRTKRVQTLGKLLLFDKQLSVNRN